MVKIPDPVAGVLAKAACLPGVHPNVYRATLVAAGLLLIHDALSPRAAVIDRRA